MSREVPQVPGSGVVHGLSEALETMTWRVEPGRFALFGFPEPLAPPLAGLLGGEGPVQITREGGETTVLCTAPLADRVRAEHPDAHAEEGLVWVRFELAMGWDLVGFLAHVTSALAAAGVSVGAVCGYSRDHLFLAESTWPRARTTLVELFGPPAGSPSNGTG